MRRGVKESGGGGGVYSYIPEEINSRGKFIWAGAPRNPSSLSPTRRAYKMHDTL